MHHPWRSVEVRDLIARPRFEHLLPGAELTVSLERLSNGDLPRDVAGKILLSERALDKGCEHPLFITARQRDQSRAWTSALFLTPT
jgi:hypothetical protein